MVSLLLLSYMSMETMPTLNMKSSEWSWLTNSGAIQYQILGKYEVQSPDSASIKYENHNIAIAMSSSSHADTDSVLAGGI